MIRKAKIYTAFAGALFLTATIVSCNNEGDSKEVKKDSTVVTTTDSTSKMAPKDTMMPMDTSMKNKDKPVVPGSSTPPGN